MLLCAVRGVHFFSSDCKSRGEGTAKVYSASEISFISAEKVGAHMQLFKSASMLLLQHFV